MFSSKEQNSKGAAQRVVVSQDDNDNGNDKIEYDKGDDKTRRMNDTTMPPPPPPPPPQSTSNKKTTTNHRPRDKVALRKGFGLKDWNRLCKVSNDLAQRKGRDLQRYGWDEIRRHNTVHDGWIVIKGKVYFISPYLAYHPGGQAILKPVLGKDGTTLFEKYHRWVNEDGLIGKLLIGYLDRSRSASSASPSYLQTQAATAPVVPAVASRDGDGFVIPTPPKKVPIASMLHDRNRISSLDAEHTDDEVDLNPWEKKKETDDSNEEES